MTWLVRVRCALSLSEPVTTLAVMAHTTGLSEMADPDVVDHVVLLIGFDEFSEADRFTAAVGDLPVECAAVERVDPSAWAVNQISSLDVAGRQLNLEIGTAFGHGEHPTTRLALDALAKLPAGAGETLLDVGSGTGVLSLAAAVLGRTATGCDIDSVAVEIATRNAERNDLTESTSFLSATPSQLATPAWLAGSTGFDVIVVNTLIGVHEAEATAITALSSSQITLLLTGLLPEHVERARAAYASFVLTQTGADDGWVLLTGKPA